MKHRFLTEKEVEEEYGLKARTLQKWRLFRKGPRFLKLGGSVKYRVSDLEAWLEKNTVTTTDGRSA
jgi:predicted DNA-binding transcriptional regulator AlpA